MPLQNHVYGLIQSLPSQHARILMTARLVALQLGGSDVVRAEVRYQSRDSLVCHIGNFNKGVCRWGSHIQQWQSE